MQNDIFNKELYRDPYEMFAEWRASSVLPYDKKTNTYALSRHADVNFALRSPEMFTSSFGGRANSIAQPFMVDVDDPGHRVQRSVIEKMLTPSAVSKHSEYVSAVIDTAVNGLIGTGSVEVVNTIAQTLPVNFVGSLMGVRPSDFPLLRKWGEAMVEGADGWENVTEEVIEAVISWFDYFDDLSKNGYWDDKEGIIPLLLNASKGNGMITYEEARGNSLAILIGGNETAKYLLSGAIDLYSEIDEISTIYGSVGPEKFINEVLRYLSPVVSSARRTTIDVAVGQNIIPANSQVMLFLTSANMDEAVFDNPRVFNPARNSSAHLSLGFGPHFCIGASLAKIQLQGLFEYFINNKIKITKDLNLPPKYKYSTFLRGVSKMHAYIEKI